MIIIKYETEAENDQIKESKLAEGYTLVEVSNVTEGNFLGFEEPDWIAPETQTPILEILLEEQVKILEAKLDEKDRENKTALFEIYNMLLGGE